MPKPKNNDVEDKVTPDAGDGVVSIPKEDYAAIMSRLESLEAKRDVAEKTGMTVAYDEDAPRVNKAQVRLFNGRPVSKLENVFRTKTYERDGSEIMECDVTYVTEDGKYEVAKGVNYMELLRSGEQQTCDILETIDIPVKVKPLNEPDRIEVVKVGDRKVEGTGTYVPNRVVLHKITYVVDFRGEKVKLESLNI